MERCVEPSSIKGHIKAPASKSMTQRAIAAALLASGESTIINPSYCDDSMAAMSIAGSLGAKVDPVPGEIKILGGRILKENTLNSGESGLAIRMFSPVAALYPEEITMTGASSLRKRPMEMIAEALNQLGARCTTTKGFLPLTIRGPMKGGRCEIDGSVSSQLLTGLLMSLPLAENDSEIHVNNLKSKPYIDMTLQLLRSFGISVESTGYEIFRVKGRQRYRSKRYTVEGDWSGGAFLLVAGAVNGSIRVQGLSTQSRQSDIAILQALRDAGAVMKIRGDEIEISRSKLKAFSLDATESPDLFPPLAALAAYCEGISAIKGVSRLKHKESDRASALREEFGKMCINIETEGDVMKITGGRPSGASVNSHGDHRIAMAAAVAALNASGSVFIKDSECVAKSYPGFFDDLRYLGVNIHE
jgi:3-phosphoshikimate 1-carboxyvinyltransferase